MGQFSIFVDIDRPGFLQEIQAGRNALSILNIRVHEEAFPSAEWLDFPVIVLTWWLEGYLALVKMNGAVTNSFMNGPFEFTGNINEDEKVIEFACWKRTLAGNVEIGPHWELSLKEYQAELITAAEHLLNSLENPSISGPDLRNLRNAFISVRAI